MRSSFLFAINTSQTWDAYRLLFQHLGRNPLLFQTSPAADNDEWNLRESLHLVSALTPQESGAYVGYFENLLGNSYDTFNEIYDADAGDDSDAFAPAPDAKDAPHSAVKVLWNDALRAFNPMAQPDLLNDPIVRAAFSDFLNKAIDLLAMTE